MASIVNATSSLRIRSVQNRAVCTISGVNPNMAAEDAVGFVAGIQTMYNRAPVTARLHVISDIEITDATA